jgi:serine/threonine protein kinase
MPLDAVAQLNAALAGHYVIDREVGRGSMASVFAAQDVKHGRRVAIKVLHPELAAAVGASRFLREIETAAKLTHPNILKRKPCCARSRVHRVTSTSSIARLRWSTSLWATTMRRSAGSTKLLAARAADVLEATWFCPDSF